MSSSPTKRPVGRLPPRLRWMAITAAGALGAEERLVDEQFRQPDTIERLSAMLEVGGPRRVFVSVKAVNKGSSDSKQGDGEGAVATSFRDICILFLKSKWCEKVKLCLSM